MAKESDNISSVRDSESNGGSVSKQPAVKSYKVTFKENRTYELHIRAMVVETFAPCETKTLSADIINHPDFKHVERLFSVKEN